MFTLEYVKNPVWASSDKQRIFLIVKWEEFNEEMPFLAASSDPEPHGLDLFNRVKSGEFGEIGVYVEPTPQPLQNY